MAAPKSQRLVQLSGLGGCGCGGPSAAPLGAATASNRSGALVALGVVAGVGLLAFVLGGGQRR